MNVATFSLTFSTAFNTGFIIFPFPIVFPPKTQTENQCKDHRQTQQRERMHFILQSRNTNMQSCHRCYWVLWVGHNINSKIKIVELEWNFSFFPKIANKNRLSSIKWSIIGTLLDNLEMELLIWILVYEIWKWMGCIRSIKMWINFCD